MDVLPEVRMLAGDRAALERAFADFSSLPVDEDRITEPAEPTRTEATTIERPMAASGPGTFFGKATRTVEFAPTDQPGWWFDRVDHPECLPVRVSIRNVWTTGNVVSNIVLRSGPPSNYIRLVEHIIALKYGFGIDNVMIRIDSGDPPLFDRGSMDLVEALDGAGRVHTGAALPYFTVSEPVALVTEGDKFLIFEPAKDGDRGLYVDCAIDFPTAIGKQRIRFPVNEACCRHGAAARTNTNLQKMITCKTVGTLFADIRNLGYSRNNVLIASRFGYVNKPGLVHEGKSLEAVWHRAVLDLLAAVALIEEGRFAGTITSYKAGHSIDVEMIRLLFKHGLLLPM